MTVPVADTGTKYQVRFIGNTIKVFSTGNCIKL